MNSYKLPLFPLAMVVCPKQNVSLRIFEARYLDMIKTCMRDKTGFGIVAVLPEAMTDQLSNLPFANVGTVVEVSDADVTTVGIILVSCNGRNRFKINGISIQSNGLVIGDISDIDNDLPVPIPDDLKVVSENLQHLIESLSLQGLSEDDIPFSKPYEFNDASWVSNRWVELLDLTLIQKQRLMQIDSPIVRLELISDELNLRTKKFN